ncbi:uncharacterized protein METZ01_LOCUS361000, partial [marine metagenome]
MEVIFGISRDAVQILASSKNFYPGRAV